MTKLLVKINKDKCIGCGGCESVAELIFRVNEKGKAEVISQEGSNEDKMLAAQACPTGAIEVENEETGEVLWPKKNTQRGGEEGEE